MSYKKVGALHFFRFGRFGGSVYLAKRKPVSHASSVLDGANAVLSVAMVAMAFVVAL